MTLSRLLAGLSVVAILAAQAGGIVGDCRTGAVPEECGCPAPEPDRDGPAIDAPCCCGCVAPDPTAPEPGDEGPLQSPAKDPVSSPPPSADASSAPAGCPESKGPVVDSPPPTPPLFLLHRAFRK